jgi:isopenicillin-N N-acyltransferase-like protein
MLGQNPLGGYVRQRLLGLQFVTLLGLMPLSALACTLWGAAGSDAGGGTLISKNRDWAPDHHQYLKQVRPSTGFAYFGLYAEGNDDPGLKAGINEKGLSIVSASSNISKKVRIAETGKHGVMIPILTHYESVDALMEDADKVFGRSYANFFVISDHSKLLIVEVGLNGLHRERLIEQGVGAHTNHYLDEALAGHFGDKPGVSSSTRLARITSLLADAPRPLSVAQFSTLSRDHVAGPNNSLWRNGRDFTLASWIVRTPASGAPEIQIVIANPDEPETTQTLVLDTAFWHKVLEK